MEIPHEGKCSIHWYSCHHYLILKIFSMDQRQGKINNWVFFNEYKISCFSVRENTLQNAHPKEALKRSPYHSIHLLCDAWQPPNRSEKGVLHVLHAAGFKPKKPDPVLQNWVWHFYQFYLQEIGNANIINLLV